MAYVYWLHLQSETDVLTQGYIGACSNIAARLRSHKHRYKAIWDDVIVTKLVQAPIGYCFEIESKLRPQKKIGWNNAAGGRTYSMFGPDNPNYGKCGKDASHFIGWYITPLGKFPNLKSAAEAHNCHLTTIRRKCCGRTTKKTFYMPQRGFAFEQKVVG